MDREEKITIVKNLIIETIPVEAIVLFGSYARNRERPDSDMDIAIKPKTELSKKEQLDLQNKIEETLDMDMHLINLDVVEDDFKYDILITGKELYVEDEMKFIEYKLRAFNDYLELNEDRQIIINKLKEGGTLYG